METTATTSTTQPPDDEFETRRERRAALKARHAQGLATLMTQRDDLRGVHALADLVDDAVRWSA
jgi:hypothetical protein